MGDSGGCLGPSGKAATGQSGLRLLSLETFLAVLTARFGDKVRQNEKLAHHTTLRLGGPAEIWLTVERADQLAEAVSLARQHSVPFFILGGGANLLISDAGLPGLVIGNRARRVQFPPVEPAIIGQPVTVVAESGAILPNLARRCVKRGLSGLEWAVGVPGTVGGAVVNNAGAYGSDIALSLSRAELLSPEGKRLWQPGEWFEYDYRVSRLKHQDRAHQWVVLTAEFVMRAALPSEVATRTDDFNARRKAAQPPGATIGSMFKNPPGDYAGRLIEAVGLKGYRQGQAQISPVHANFFQNLGQAQAAEVINLIQTAQAAVTEKFDITLELEIEVVGDFGQR